MRSDLVHNPFRSRLHIVDGPETHRWICKQVMKTKAE